MIQDAVSRIRARSEAAGLPSNDILRGWADGVGSRSFKSLAFGRVLRRAVHSHLDGDATTFELASRWLSGEVTVTATAKAVGESAMKQSELKVHALNARLSLFQFIKHAGFRGTIVGFDEAEQGLATDKKRMQTIFSHLLSEINALADLSDGAALVVHAVTSDVLEKIQVATPMLAQRLADPGPNQGFFDGNPFAATINLRQREDPVHDLTRIGNRLLDAFLSFVTTLEENQVFAMRTEIDMMAAAVASEDQSSSARRLMVKRTCTYLLRIRAPQWTARPRAAEPEV